MKFMDTFVFMWTKTEMKEDMNMNMTQVNITETMK